MTDGWPGALSGQQLIQQLRSHPGYTVLVEVAHEHYAILDVEYDEGMQTIRIKASKD